MLGTCGLESMRQAAWFFTAVSGRVVFHSWASSGSKGRVVFHCRVRPRGRGRANECRHEGQKEAEEEREVWETKGLSAEPRNGHGKPRTVHVQAGHGQGDRRPSR